MIEERAQLGQANEVPVLTARNMGDPAAPLRAAGGVVGRGGPDLDDERMGVGLYGSYGRASLLAPPNRAPVSRTVSRDV